MASPCADNTNTILLDETAAGHLTADLKIDPASPLSSTVAGTKINFANPSGLEIVSGALRVKVDGGGVVVTTAGLAKVNLATRFGWGPRSATGFVAVTQNINRGATADIDTALGAIIANTGPVAQRVTVISTWLIDYQTTFSGFETTNLFDSAFVQLQTNFNSLGYGDSDFSGLLNSQQSTRVLLKCIDNISCPAEDTVSYQVKPVSVGGTASATAVQGHVKGRGAGSILIIQ
jgi:hypothetical protein